MGDDRDDDGGAFDGAQAASMPDELLAAIDELVEPDIVLRPASSSIRYRHVVKEGRDVYLLFNEEADPVTATLTVSATGTWQWLDPATGSATDGVPGDPVTLPPHEMKVLSVGLPPTD